MLMEAWFKTDQGAGENGVGLGMVRPVFGLHLAGLSDLSPRIRVARSTICGL